MNKKVNVWDTYVTRKDGSIMHFDILTPVGVVDEDQVHSFGKAYLSTKGEEGQLLTAKECKFCHVDSILPQWGKELADNGYLIIEMEGC